MYSVLTTKPADLEQFFTAVAKSMDCNACMFRKLCKADEDETVDCKDFVVKMYEGAK